MSTATSHDPFFFVATASSFERDLVADVAAGRCTGIRVPGLMPQSTCEQILRALTDVEFESYGAKRVFPPVMRFGVGVSDHRQLGKVADTYWHALRASKIEWQSLGLPLDPFALCREAIGEHWPNAMKVGQRDGREMGAGVAREPNQGFIVHYDDAGREFSGNLLDTNLIAQFAFNLYISVPKMGGETVIWRHRWHPADEIHRLPNSYGFAESVIKDAESFELKPSVGEALLFDPRNFHAVRASHDSRRIALGFSVGLGDTGELFAWG
ncbi:MAG TPA: hypothetical protein VFO27_06050 [Bryobacteraceae bacterium]|nr:hypothetical protein [Bryobacteraceae bacterium]